MSKEILCIAFDIGNVVYDLNFHNLIDALAYRSGKPLSTVQSLFADNFHIGADERSLNERFQLGLLSSEDYFQQLYLALDETVSIEDLHAAWLSILVTENQDTLDIIRDLQGKVKMGCLSNTHQQHWDYFHDNSEAFTYFEVKVGSHLAGVAKPDPAIYHQFTKAAKVAPSQCLLIDDLAQNVAGALACGWQAIQFDGSKPLKKLLAQVDTVKPHLAL